VLRASIHIGPLGWIKVVVLFAALLWIVYSGFRPGLGNSKKWQDRAIRIVVGLLILVCMAYGLFLLLRAT